MCLLCCVQKKIVQQRSNRKAKCTKNVCQYVFSNVWVWCAGSEHCTHEVFIHRCHHLHAVLPATFRTTSLWRQLKPPSIHRNRNQAKTCSHKATWEQRTSQRVLLERFSQGYIVAACVWVYLQMQRSSLQQRRIALCGEGITKLGILMHSILPWPCVSLSESWNVF